MSFEPGPISAIAAAVRSGRISATSVTQAAIERLVAVNPTLNVLADSAFDDALRNARALDDGDVRGPLAGIPTLIKDLEDWRGHPTRKGSLALRDAPPATNNSVVTQRLVDGGAIIASGAPRDLMASLRAGHILELTPARDSVSVDCTRLESIAGVSSVRDDDGKIRLQVQELHASLPLVLDELTRQRVALSNLETHSPTLEDFYVALTGRHLRDD